MPKNYDEFAIARRRLGCSRMQWGSFGWKTTTSARIGGGCTGTHKAQCSEPDKDYPRTVGKLLVTVDRQAANRSSDPFHLG